jgi:predicted SAM-dependent methyltransferase
MISGRIRDRLPPGLRESLARKTRTGVGSVLRDLLDEVTIAWTHYRSLGVARKYQGNGYKLNLGCGANTKPGWVNVDLSPEADLRLDLRRPLPFADGSVAVIYSEHFFEHLTYPDEALRFLEEARRVLESGGLFSVGVPDAEVVVRAYCEEDKEYFQWAREHWHPEWADTPMHSLNYLFHDHRGAHKHVYDAETLALVLERTGFTSPRRRDFDPTLDSEARRVGTLYVDARKP